MIHSLQKMVLWHSGCVAPTTLEFHVRVLVQGLGNLLLIQLPTNMSRRTKNDGSKTWTPDSNVRDPYGVNVSWLGSGSDWVWQFRMWNRSWKNLLCLPASDLQIKSKNTKFLYTVNRKDGIFLVYFFKIMHNFFITHFHELF